MADSEQQLEALLPDWYTLDDEDPRLIGGHCQACKTWYFPNQLQYCRNPDCDSSELVATPLSSRGELWSFSQQCYPPPPPYVVSEPFEPYIIAGVQLHEEKILILGQLATGIALEQLSIGMPMRMVLEPLPDEKDSSKLVWKWQPEPAQ